MDPIRTNEDAIAALRRMTTTPGMASEWLRAHGLSDRWNTTLERVRVMFENGLLVHERVGDYLYAANKTDCIVGIIEFLIHCYDNGESFSASRDPRNVKAWVERELTALEGYVGAIERKAVASSRYAIETSMRAMNQVSVFTTLPAEVVAAVASLTGDPRVHQEGDALGIAQDALESDRMLVVDQSALRKTTIKQSP